MWENQRYHSLSYELKQNFGEKVVKLSLDGSFSCPNRDGTLGSNGCIFCGERGSGDFAASPSLSIAEQIASQQVLLSNKWPKAKYLAYFQNFTTTYAPLTKLESLYSAALKVEDVVGLALATRCDCLPNDVLDLLAKYARKTYLWIELGLQSAKPQSLKLLKTGYTPKDFENAIRELHSRQIKVVAHLIFGLPGESKEDMLASVRFLAQLKIWGIKIHLLHIQKDTPLYYHYKARPFPLLEKEQYVDIVCDALELLPPEVIIHRLTGDGNRELLVAPKWSRDKLRILSAIDAEMRRRESIQGSRVPYSQRVEM